MAAGFSRDHMQRVIAQGDMRPMADNRESMSDLQRILAVREPLYRKADLTIDTSKQPSGERDGAHDRTLSRATSLADQHATIFPLQIPGREMHYNASHRIFRPVGRPGPLHCSACPFVPKMRRAYA